MGNSTCKTGFVFSLSLLLFLLVLILSTTFIISGSAPLGRIIFAATQLQDKANVAIHVNDTGPSAQLVYQTQSMNIPPSVGTFIWYIRNMKLMKILLHNPGSMLVITMPSTFQLILLSLKGLLSPCLMPMLRGILPILIQ